MRVSKYYRHDDIRIEEMPIPQIKAGELLLEVKACGLCGSDAMTWYADQKAPTVLGHEPTGVVAQVGEGVKDFAVGDRIFAHHHVPCLVCHYCQHGDYAMCPTFHQTNLDPGGFAEYVRVPAANVALDTLQLPEGMSYEAGTLVEPLGCGVRAFKQVPFHPGDTVMILGAGVSGLLMGQLARLWGAGLVGISDLVDFRLRVAGDLGIDLTIRADVEDVAARLRKANRDRLADLVIVTPGSVLAMEEGMKLLDKGGTVLFYAPSPPGQELGLDCNSLFWQGQTIATTYSCGPEDTRLALDLIARHRVEVERLITHRLGLDQVGEGLRLMAEAKDSLKVVIIP